MSETKFYQNKDGQMTVDCPFGQGAKVGSTHCEHVCAFFVKMVWNVRPSTDVPVQGTVTCNGEKK
jgi:hypothetical protein